jgi:predicted LPLAT superfamily acyltransferase
MENRKMTQDWTQKKEYGSTKSLRLMVWLATILGRRATRVLLYPIAVYFVMLVGDARKASIGYLTKVLGREPTWNEVFRHFHTFACVLLDRIFLLLGRAELFDIRIVENAYAEQDAATRANGVFLMGAHMGSFEAVRLVSRTQANLQLVLLMYEENARKIGTLIAAINPMAQQEIVPLGKLSAMLTVRERLAEGAVVGILADRTLKHEKEIRIPFLGDPAYLAAGPFRMAAMLRRPVFLMVGLYRGGNRYDIHLEKIADFGNIQGNTDAVVEAAIRRYAERLEYFVRLAPYNWFNFYDFWQGDA